jgi:hypothetical protein
MKIRILLNEQNQFATGVTRPAEQTQDSALRAIQDYYKLKIVAPVSIGLTAFSDVYLVEPADVSMYPQKELILKLSKDPNEYRAYRQIKDIKSRMLGSNEPEDKDASLYLPQIYTAESIPPEVESLDYDSIIVMEKLLPFTGVLRQKQLATTLTGTPTKSVKTLLYMLNDEAFIDRTIKHMFDVMEESTDVLMGYRTLNPSSFMINKIVGDIVSGKEPPLNLNDEDTNIMVNLVRGIVRKKIAPGPMAKVELPVPSSYYMDKAKRTPEQQKEVDKYLAQSDYNDKIFLKEVNQVRMEMYRIGEVFVYYAKKYGDLRNVELMMDTFLDIITKSTPVAPMSAINPYPQNIKTKPEQVVPGAESFARALEILEDYGMKRADLHGKNYMMRQDGHIVISDPGMFASKKAVKESKK